MRNLAALYDLFLTGSLMITTCSERLKLSSRFGSEAFATSPPALLYRTDAMEPVPLEVWTAFLAIAAGGFALLVGYILNYIIDKWRK
jgi:hypothetical protein